MNALPAQVLSVFIPFFNLGFNSNSLVFMLCYVWSKNFATTPCSLYGLMTIQVPHAGMRTRCLLWGHRSRQQSWLSDRECDLHDE